jgi:hypothetical protein
LQPNQCKNINWIAVTKRVTQVNLLLFFGLTFVKLQCKLLKLATYNAQPHEIQPQKQAKLFFAKRL